MKTRIVIFLLLNFFVTNLYAQSEKEGYIIMDMVHHNPGEELTNSVFRNPEKLASYDFNAMVINEFKFPQCALTFDKLDKRIFLKNSEERKWAEALRKEIKSRISECHKNGLKCYFFTDIIVLPKRLVELYKDEICDEAGRISFSKPKTWEIHRLMVKELFDVFPEMDGLVIRTGETYTHNIPYHMGNGPVDYKNNYEESIEIHTRLMNLLREEVCVKRNKHIIYRTWDFGYFHTRPDYYLKVTDNVEPHKNLYISIKHTNGDYFRTFPFNKTITLGNHKQVIEVQCQREYEGKGAYPNYVANAVINGFEETKNHASPRCLNDIKDHPNFYGVWTWSRGGGWYGPYISNELWCDINTYVMSQWGLNTERSEEEIFNEYALKIGITPESLPYFRKLCLLTPDAIIRGRGSLIRNVSVTWTRDDIVGGVVRLNKNFDRIIEKNQVDEALYEMKLSTAIWQEIDELAAKVKCTDKEIEKYIQTSSRYGYLLYALMEQGWIVNLRGYIYDKQGVLDKVAIVEAIQKFDVLEKEYQRLKEENPECASLYHFRYPGGHTFGYKDKEEMYGMGVFVDKYRELVK